MDPEVALAIHDGQVTACMSEQPKPGAGFFPLTVNYQEKAYAGGRIPGSFFKREGRPSDSETLTCRLIDRPIRPLFPEGFLNDTQIMATVISADQDNDAGILAMIGASAALEVSDIPFFGPIAGVKVGRVDGSFIANPTAAQLEQSDIEARNASTSAKPLSSARSVSSGVRLCSSSRVSWASLAILRFCERSCVCMALTNNFPFPAFGRLGMSSNAHGSRFSEHSSAPRCAGVDRPW